MTIILYAPIIYITVDRGFDYVVVELGIVGLIFLIEMGLSFPISPWKVAKNIRAHVRLWTDIFYSLQVFPKAIEFALTEAAPRQG